MRQQTVKSTWYLTDILTNTDLTRQDKIFNPYMACTQMNTHESDKQEDRTLNQQNVGISVDKNVADVRQGYDSRFEFTKDKFTWCNQKSRKGEIKMISRCISHKP